MGGKDLAGARVLDCLLETQAAVHPRFTDALDGQEAGVTFVHMKYPAGDRLARGKLPNCMQTKIKLFLLQWKITILETKQCTEK